MSDQRTTSATYLLGHSPEAVQPLVKMGRVLNPGRAPARGDCRQRGGRARTCPHLGLDSGRL